MITQDIHAARLVLMALRASLPPHETALPGRVAFAPDGATLSEDAAARVLASKSRPLECRAHAADGTLVVNCSDVSEEWRFIHQFQLEDLSSSDGPIGGLRAGARRRDAETVLVVGEGESLLVPTDALEAWARDYVITLPLGVTLRSADDAERALGVESVIEFGHVEEVDPRSEIARQLFEFRRARRSPTD